MRGRDGGDQSCAGQWCPTLALVCRNVQFCHPPPPSVTPPLVSPSHWAEVTGHLCQVKLQTKVHEDFLKISQSWGRPLLLVESA